MYADRDVIGNVISFSNGVSTWALSADLTVRQRMRTSGFQGDALKSAVSQVSCRAWHSPTPSANTSFYAAVPPWILVQIEFGTYIFTYVQPGA